MGNKMEMEPCPLCGELMQHGHDTASHVEQGDCLYAFGGRDAAERYNRRSPSPDMREAVKATDTRPWQFDIVPDRSTYPGGPLATGKNPYRVIGWEGGDRGGLLLSPDEHSAIVDALQLALRSLTGGSNG